MTDRYVLLTGSKNNAGDFLIKKRATALLATQRPDRELVDMNAWEPIDDRKLEIINRSKALILTGGPSLQKNMYPGIYALRPKLDEIKVPVLAMGIGWKSLTGNWSDTRDYPLSASTLQLLERIDASGYLSSVRDHHTFNVLLNRGFTNFRMTGCPALFASPAERAPDLEKPVEKVSFSLGVSFLSSRAMERQMKDIVLMLAEKFGADNVTTVFHHSTSANFLETHNATKHHLQGHLKFIEWLDAQALPHVDISGSAETMIAHYAKADLHVGYRVHAHILMSSLSRPSLLLAEDGRGKALRDVIGGGVFDSMLEVSDSKLSKLKRRLRVFETVRPVEACVTDVRNEIERQIESGWQMTRDSEVAIGALRREMSNFMLQLP